MAKTRSLPDKFYDKDYEHNGIHRVPLWRIAGFALNNTATNLYLMMMNYATYYLMGWVGVGMMVASSLTMMMRIWDGVTDPFVGFMVDKTNGKFGKNRPFIVIGNIILCVTSFIAFHVTHKLPEAVRFPFYVIVLMIYYLGYTCQCVVTKSAQSCMTNDPKQRPMFASFDGVFNTLLFAGLGVIIPRIADGYTDVGGYASTQFMHTLWLMTAITSACFTAIAVIAITPKDRPEFFGTGKPVKVGLKDYWDTLKNNRAIQMLVLQSPAPLPLQCSPASPVPTCCRVMLPVWSPFPAASSPSCSSVTLQPSWASVRQCWLALLAAWSSMARWQLCGCGAILRP